MNTIGTENACGVLGSRASSSSGSRLAGRQRTAVLLVFGASALLVGLFLWAFPARTRVDLGSDYVSFYEPVASRILEGHGLTVPDGGLATRYPPGFPLLLAGLLAVAGFAGISMETLLALFMSVGVGIAAALVFMIARTVWPPGRAVIGASLFATYPLLLWLTRQPNSEIPFLVPLYAAVLLLIVSVERGHRTSALASGVAIGLATLIRPITIVLGVVMAAMALWVRRDLAFRTRAALAALILVGNFVAVLPWEWWLYQRTGKLILVSTGGKKSIRDGLSFSGSRKGFRGPVAVPSGVAAIVRDVETEWDNGNLKTFGQVRSFVAAEIRQRPLAAGELLALKAARSWYATDSHRNERPLLAMQVLYLALIAYGGVRTRRAGGAGARMLWVVAAVAGYFWLMTIVALSIVRYMVPAIGLLFVLVPAALPGKAADA